MKTGKEPLYIVDGVPIQKKNNTVIAQFDPESIAKMNRYHSSKAKQLFGKIAKNGCIVITTKKGNYDIENDENYTKLSENNFEETSLNPLSTFSIDVDKAGYSNVRRLLNNGERVPVDAVKIEEIRFWETQRSKRPLLGYVLLGFFLGLVFDLIISLRKQPST